MKQRELLKIPDKIFGIDQDQDDLAWAVAVIYSKASDIVKWIWENYWPIYNWAQSKYIS